MVLRVYIIHSRTVAPVRRDPTLALCAQLQQHAPGLQVSFVDGFEPDEITPELIRNTTNLDKPGDERFDGLLDNLHRRNLSNTLKHHIALKHIVETDPSGEHHHLILEDDVVAGDASPAALAEVIARSDGADITFLGLPAPAAGVSSSSSRSDFDVRAVYNVLPSCESYLIKPSAAAKLAAALLPIKFRTNVQISYALHVLHPDLRVRATQPTIFMDGSKLGATISTIEANNALIYNASFGALEQRLAPSAPKPSVQEVRELAASTTSQHPDVQYRLGLLFKRAGDKVEALKRFQAAYAEYKAGHAVINSRSHFLKAYIDLHRPESKAAVVA